MWVWVFSVTQSNGRLWFKPAHLLLYPAPLLCFGNNMGVDL